MHTLAACCKCEILWLTLNNHERHSNLIAASVQCTKRHDPLKEQIESFGFCASIFFPEKMLWKKINNSFLLSSHQAICKEKYFQTKPYLFHNSVFKVTQPDKKRFSALYPRCQ